MAESGSVDDDLLFLVTHTLHYLLKILENMQRVDNVQGGGVEPEE